MYFKIYSKETGRILIRKKEISLLRLNEIFLQEYYVNNDSLLGELIKIKNKNDLILNKDNDVIRNFFLGIVNDNIYLDWSHKGTYFSFNEKLIMTNNVKIKILLD